MSYYGKITTILKIISHILDKVNVLKYKRKIFITHVDSGQAMVLSNKTDTWMQRRLRPKNARI